MKKRPGDENRPSRQSRRKPRPRESPIVGEARRLKSAYILERQFFDSQRSGKQEAYKPGRRLDGGKLLSRGAHVHDMLDEAVEDTELDNVWQKIAKGLWAKEIDPVDYVQRVFFMLVGKETNPPTPAQLLSDRYMELYRLSRRRLRQDLTASLRCQQTTARTELTHLQQFGGETMLSAFSLVLDDEALELTPLFRYCLARSLRRKDFSARAKKEFLDAAALQYVRAREEYDVVWGNFIPLDFKRLAQKAYDDLIV